jgi:hypothetical protein
MSGLKNSLPSSCMLWSLVYSFNTLESASSIPIEQYHCECILFYFTSNTLGSYFWCMVLVLSFLPFYTRHIQLPGNNDLCPPKIHNNSKFWPFFEDVLSALDGSHIQCSPPAHSCGLYRNQKGFFYCLFALSFNMYFTYSLCGWCKGNLTDLRRILHLSLAKGNPK